MDFFGYHNCRNRHGGGVSVYVRSYLSVAVMKEISLSFETIEILFLKTKINGCDVVIGCIYRRPGAKTDEFVEVMGNILERLMSFNKCKMLLCGDFNINLLSNMTETRNLRYVEPLYAGGYPTSRSSYGLLEWGLCQQL